MAISKITSDAIDVTGFNLDGDVGIGTAPSNKLDVLSSGAVAARFKRNNTGGASGGISVGNNDKLFTFYVDNSGGLQFYEDSTERIRFQLGGGISFNGDTAAANALDDYEEGTFTATLRGSTGEPATLVTTTATYTKIGNRVFIVIAFENVNSTGYSGQILVDQLPFNCSQERAIFYIGSFRGMNWTDTPIGVLGNNTSSMFLQDQISGSAWAAATHNASSSTYFWITGHYITAA